MGRTPRRHTIPPTDRKSHHGPTACQTSHGPEEENLGRDCPSKIPSPWQNVLRASVGKIPWTPTMGPCHRSQKGRTNIDQLQGVSHGSQRERRAKEIH